MLNDNVKKLVEFAKTTDLQQTFFFLEENGCYCFLGLACLVYEQETGVSLKRNESPKRFGFRNGSLPSEVRQYYGFSSSDGAFDYNLKGSCTLTGLNDNMGWGFKEIAEFIETDPEGLFV